MINRLSKYYSIILLAVTLLITAFFTTSSGYDFVMSTFSSLSEAYFPYSEGSCIASILALSVALATALLSVFIASIIALVIKLLTKKEGAIEMLPKPKLKLLSYFMFCSIALCLLTPLSLLLFGNEPLIFPNYYSFLFIYFTWGIFVVAIICAALIQSAVAMWTSAKAVSIILLIVSFIGINIAIAIPIAMLGNIRYYCYEQTLDEAENVEPQAYEYEDEGVEEEVESDDIYVENYLEDLWDDPSEDTQNVRKALNYLIGQFKGSTYTEYADSGEKVNRWDILGTWSYLNLSGEQEGEQEEGASKLSAIYNYINGDDNVIYKSFMSYEELIYDKISNRTYYSSGLSKLTNALNMAYTDLLADDSTDKVSRIAKLMNSGLYSWATDYSNDMKQYASKDALEFFTTEGELDQQLFVWAYSFWARRYQEGTISSCHRILNRIFEHYDDY